MSPKIFPTVLMTLDFLAGVVYLAHVDIRHAVYWASAGILTATVTY